MNALALLSQGGLKMKDTKSSQCSMSYKVPVIMSFWQKHMQRSGFSLQTTKTLVKWFTEKTVPIAASSFCDYAISAPS